MPRTYEVRFQVTSHSITKSRIEEELKFTQIPNVENLVIKQVNTDALEYAIYHNTHKGTTVHKMDCRHIKRRKSSREGSIWYLNLTRIAAFYVGSLLEPRRRYTCKTCDPFELHKYDVYNKWKVAKEKSHLAQIGQSVFVVKDSEKGEKE